MSNFSIALLVSAIASVFFTDIDEGTSQYEAVAVQEVVEDCLEEIPPGIYSVDGDTSKVKENPNDRAGDATTQEYVPPMLLGNPSNIETTFELTEDGTGYNIYERVGGIDIRPPSYISFEDYLAYRKEKGISDYFRQQGLSSNEENKPGLIPSFELGNVTDIFGGGTVEIRPTGYATLDFSIDQNKTANPNLSTRQQKVTTFNFDQQIQLGVIGQIGEKMRLNFNFDTQATFDFENELKLEHSGTEDQILQKIEAGNVSMPLGNSLIQGRQNLFGLKLGLKFGPVSITSVASTERGQVETINVSGGGAVETPFEKEVSDYDMNRHFFLSHYFRSRYETALVNLPIINSPVQINRVEVWIQRTGSTRNNRNGVGLVDLGENNQGAAQARGVVFNTDVVTPAGGTLPDNDANNLFGLVTGSPQARELSGAKTSLEALGLRNTLDFEVLGNMRKLETNEYTLHPQLGYVSLNSPIPNDQVLFVSYNYTANGQIFQVGEFSDDVPSNGLNSNVLFLKQLKSSVLRPVFDGAAYPPWDLMMKNIYNIGYGIQREGFFLDIQYESGTNAGKVNFLPGGAVKNVPLMQVTNVDRLTNHTAPLPDNIFDFVEGLTIISDRGMVIFPVLEPFGSHLNRQLNNSPDDSATYVFQALYDDTPQGAIQNFPQLNRYSLEGYYRSAGGSEIPLNTFNLAEGSVIVTAGTRQLIEGQDFIVDYLGGKIQIINDAILTSGQEIAVSFESSSLYNIQTKTLLGSRVEYSTSDDFVVGATILNLREQPFNQKTTLGDEPVNNTLWGLDLSLNKESDFLTKLIDRVPLLSTKETSTITAAGEFAQFVPGQPSVVKTDDERGIVFLDDFEAAKTTFTLQGQQRWKLASFPENDTDPNLYDPTAVYNHPLATNFTRAKMSWYQIDQGIYQGRGGIEIPESDLANNFTRRITPNEIFPTASRAFGSNNIQPTFDIHYIPEKRGPYNYQTDPDKLDPATGDFSSPKENWAGIMREIDVNNDFEATNVEFVEFWLMDPYLANPNHSGGQLYLNLGLVNEDVLPDGSLSKENGLPGDPTVLSNVNETAWGRIPIGNPPTDAFDNDGDNRVNQDVGLDGLSDENERVFFDSIFLDPLRTVLNPAIMAAVEADPSTDNFVHFRDGIYNAQTASIIDRYVEFNGVDGNSPPGENNNTGFTVQATQQPDTEDLNDNGSINFAEQYWEYRIDLTENALQPGINFVVDELDTTIVVDNRGTQTDVKWYQFRVPLNAGKSINSIPNFKSISYMRMYMSGFEEETILRMTEFQLVSTQWRRYLDPLVDDQQIILPPDPPFATFEVGSVSLEENSQKMPFNYQLPPGVRQQQINGNTQSGFLENERSLLLNVCNLDDGDARAVFKGVRQDLRQYERLKMWVHAEAVDDGIQPSNFFQPGDATAFIRLGLDNDFNYYEYEIPLTPSNVNMGAGNINNTWLEENQFDIDLAFLALAKEDRNINSTTGVVNRYLFEDTDLLPPGHKIYIKGTPKLSDVRNIMIGVRNPEDPDAEKICLEVWVNELRLTNFDQKSGWAANASMDVRLADIGSFRGSISRKTAGFGPLDQKISNRTQEDVLQYDLASNMFLDKFFPKKWNLQMPVYATFGERFVNPIYDPQEADVRTDKLIENMDPEQKKATLTRIQDYRQKRSISFNNWKKNRSIPEGRPGASRETKAHFYDFSNLDFTFAYNEEFARSSTIERRFNTQHRAAVNYRHTFKPVSIEPFKKWKKGGILKDINFSPIPTSVSFSMDGNRMFEERLMRPTNQFGGGVDPTFNKNFMITRNYNLAWNLTRSLQVSYSAITQARVDEVRGYWETADELEKDTVGTLWENLIHFGKDPSKGHNNLVNFGRTTNFSQNINVGYQLPFSQIKWTDWISGTVNYTGSYNWLQAPEINPALGNTIGNTQNIQGNTRVDLKGFYRKFGFLKKLLDKQNQKGKPQAKGPRRPESDTPQRPGQVEPETAEADSVKKPDPFKYLKLVGTEVVRIMLSVQSIDVNYSRNANTILPGYLPRPDNFGLDIGYIDTFGTGASPFLPPTPGFVFGSQRDIRQLAGENNWISRDTTLSNYFAQNVSEQFTARTSVELFKGFRIDLSVSRNLSENVSELFRWQEDTLGGGQYIQQNQLIAGNFTMSYIFANTAFEQNAEDSPIFQDFSQNRQAISERLAGKNPNLASLSRQGVVEGGYQNGYTGTSQDVLISSLLSSYGLLGPSKVDLSSFPKIPLPNWSINYNGLSNLPFLKKYFNSVTIKHTYRGTFSVNTFNSNLNANDPDSDGFAENATVVGQDVNGDDLENFYSVRSIPTVQIQEQFAPLLGFQMNWKNGITSSIDYKTGRQLRFSVGNLQLTEMRNQDLAIMLGYRKDKLNWNFRFLGRDFNLENSMNAQFRMTMRDTRERNRTLSATGLNTDPTLSAQYTRGAMNLIISPSIDYVVSSRLNVKLYFEKNINSPYVSNTYRTSFTSGGFQIRFTLTN